MGEILAYLQLVGIAYFPERSKYLRLIQAMDNAYFEHLAETRPKDPH